MASVDEFDFDNNGFAYTPQRGKQMGHSDAVENKLHSSGIVKAGSAMAGNCVENVPYDTHSGGLSTGYEPVPALCLPWKSGSLLEASPLHWSLRVSLGVDHPSQ